MLESLELESWKIWNFMLENAEQSWETNYPTSIRNFQLWEISNLYLPILYRPLQLHVYVSLLYVFTLID